MTARVVNAWSTPDEVRGDEIADKKRSQSERTTPAQRTLGNDFGYGTAADKAQDEQTARHRQTKYGQRVCQHVVAERPPLSEQSEAQSNDSDPAVPTGDQAL